MNAFEIESHRVGDQGRVFTIAEVGLAHEGSLGAAHAYIDAVAETGATAVKFQTHIAAEESTSRETFRVKVFPQDGSRYDYWQRTSFEKSQWLELAAHARDAGLVFLSSPFSQLAVEWLMDCDVGAWKVASGEVSNHPMLESMAQTGKPMLLSSGMSRWSELDKAIDIARTSSSPLGVFQCTTSYPCPPEQWGLNMLSELRDRYHCPVGLSDHSGGLAACIAAVALGADMLEFHVVFDKRQFGPDTQASVTMQQATELVQSVSDLKTALHNPLDKDRQSESLDALHQLFTKSVVAARDLDAGHRLSLDDLAFKKPGTGWPASDYTSLVGRTLNRAITADHFFTIEDFS